jgi:hypothetical protein
MRNPFTTLKSIVQAALERRRIATKRSRRGGGFATSSREDEIAKASPERAGELAGHPVERVDT